MSGQFRYVSYDLRDTTRHEFYIHEINGSLYINFTRVNDRLKARFDAAPFPDAEGLPNPVLGIIDPDTRTELGFVELIQKYDVDFGFRILSRTTSPLIEGTYYAVEPDWAPPADFVVDPRENRGWTAQTADVIDGERVVEQIVSWEGGYGTRPPTGQYIGPKGWVTDIADATDKRGPAGEDGETEDISDVRSNIEQINALTADLKLETPPLWVNATDGVIATLDAAGTIDSSSINAYTGWSATPTIPNYANVGVVIRVPEDAHIGDYRISTTGQAIALNGLVKLADAGLTGFDYYSLLLTTRGTGREPGNTLTLQHHGADTHTEFLGQLARDMVIQAIADLLLPDPSTGAAGQVAIVNASRDGYVLANQSGGGSAAITTQLQQTIDNLVEKTLDIVITKRPSWVLSDQTKAQFTSIERGSTAAQHLSNRQAPTGATGWTNDVTLTSTRVLVVRIKADENLSDYRFLFDQPPGVTLNFSALTEYASDTNWKYYAENTLTNTNTGRIRLQHHGVDVTSRYIGDLDKDKVVNLVRDTFLTISPRRYDTMPDSLLEGQVIYLTQNDNSGGTNYRKGTYQGVDQGGTIVPTQVLVPNQEVLLDALQRIVPTVPTDDTKRHLTETAGKMAWEEITAITGGSTPHFTTAAPAGSLGKVGDWHLNTDNGVLSVKTSDTAWNGRTTLFTFFSFQHLLNRWQKERAADFVLTGNTTGTFNIDVEGADSLLHSSTPPATSLQTKHGTDIALLVSMRIARSDNTDGSVNIKVKNSTGILTEFTSNIHSASQEIEIYSPVTRLINNTFVFEVTTSGFAAATAITLSSVRVNLNEISRIDTPRRVLSLPRPKLGNTVYLKDQAGTSPAGKYHCFNVEDGYQLVDAMPPAPSNTQKNGKVLKYDGQNLAFSDSNPSYAIFNIDANKSITPNLSSFTFGAALKRSNNISGFISLRSSDRLAIELKPGTYIIDTHIVMDDTSQGVGSNRANFEVQLWDGNAELDSLDNVGYLRNIDGQPDIESFQTTHTITLTADTNVSVRIKRYSDTSQLTSLVTVAGGTVTVRKL